MRIIYLCNRYLNHLIMKRIVIIFAVTLSIMGMVSCEKEESKDPNSIPVYVRMSFTHYATESMIEYCNIIASHSDGINEKSHTIKPNEWKRIDEFSNDLEWADTIETALPAVLSFTRIMTVKDSSNISRVYDDYNKYITSWGGYPLNANKDSIPDRGRKIRIEYYGTNLPRLDTIKYVFYINEDGYWTDADGNLIDY